MNAITMHNSRSFRLSAIFGIGMLLCAPTLVSAQVSLATVVDLAQRNSPAVRLAQADISKAQASYAATRDAIIPSIELRTGLPIFPEVGFTGTPPSIISASVQSLVYGLPQKRYIDAAGYGVKAAFSNLKDAQEQVALDASTAYIEMDTVDSELAAARQQEEFAANLVNIETKRSEAGVDSSLDLLQTRLTAAQLRLKRLHLEVRSSRLANQLPRSPACPSAPFCRITQASPKSPASPAIPPPAPSPQSVRRSCWPNRSSSRRRGTGRSTIFHSWASAPSTTATPRF
jgi:hypothetical protein